MNDNVDKKKKIKQFKIMSYPTLIKVSPNGNLERFTDERTIENIEKFLQIKPHK